MGKNCMPKSFYITLFYIMLVSINLIIISGYFVAKDEFKIANGNTTKGSWSRSSVYYRQSLENLNSSRLALVIILIMDCLIFFTN